MTTRSPRVGPSTPEREERQADELDRHYTTLVLHPSLAAATYRGLTDGTPKPAYDALRSLVRGDWWLPSTAFRTDETGSFVLDAYAGEYTISARGGQAPLTLAAGTPEVIVPLPSAGDPLT